MNTMKRKLLVAVITSMMVVSLAACGKKNDVAPEAEKTIEMADETQDQVEEGIPEDEFMPDCFLDARTMKNIYESYDEIISFLQEGEGYAYVKLIGCDEDVLAITDGVYDNLDGNMASIDVSLYYGKEGNVKNIGNAFSAGTAYPIANDDGLLYTAGNHCYTSYFVSDETGGLMVKDSIMEEFDTDGNATYYTLHREENNFNNDSEIEINEQQDFYDYIDEFTTKTIVNFTVVK